MSRILDKFFNTTTYKQEFCAGQQLPRDVKKPDKSAGMKTFISEVPFIPYPSMSKECPCQAGGFMPPRGAKARGLSTNLDIKCGCFLGKKCIQPPPPIKSEVAENVLPEKTICLETEKNSENLYPQKKKSPPHSKAEIVKPLCPRMRALRPLPRGKFGGQRCPQRNQRQGGGRNSGPPWLNERRDERRNPDVLRLNRQHPRGEIRDVIHGEGGRASDGGRNEPGRRRVSQTRSDVRIPGPFWTRQRPDERREVDVPRRRKFESFSDIKDVIHGEGPRGRRRQSEDLSLKCRRTSSSRIPFWMNKRPDERREPDVMRKRRIEQRGELSDVIHGEEARAREWQEGRNRRRENRAPVNPYDLPPGPSHADPFWMLERQDERRDPDLDRKRKFGRQRIQAAEIVHGEDFRARWDPPQEEPDQPEEGGDSDDDDSEPFPFTKACKCAPAPRQSGLDDWIVKSSWRGAEKGPSGRKEYNPPADGGEKPTEARLSCAPEADVSSFDQPNTFMRKLYEKYPHLYQILKETPPEELISRVFKDRFLSTYQVDYLHLGAGTEDTTRGEGAQRLGVQRDGEPEIVPGCSYRHSQKGNFGRKKVEMKDRDKKDEEEPEKEDNIGLSEYMSTISKLGGEIIRDKLYTREELIKMKKFQINS